MGKTTIAVLKSDHSVCSSSCQFAYIAFADGDCYAYACAKYDKPLGWYPGLKRVSECINDTKPKKGR